MPAGDTVALTTGSAAFLDRDPPIFGRVVDDAFVLWETGQLVQFVGSPAPVDTILDASAAEVQAWLGRRVEVLAPIPNAATRARGYVCGVYIREDGARNQTEFLLIHVDGAPMQGGPPSAGYWYEAEPAQVQLVD